MPCSATQSPVPSYLNYPPWPYMCVQPWTPYVLPHLLPTLSCCWSCIEWLLPSHRWLDGLGGSPPVLEWVGSSIDHDPIINAQVILPRGDRHEMGQVLGWKHNSDGLLIGHKNKILSLDSCVYTVHWANGEEEDFIYNQITEHLYSQVDEEGN